MSIHIRKVKLAIVIFTSALGIIVFTSPTSFAQTPSNYFFGIRSIYTREYGITNPVGLAFVKAANTFVVHDMPKAGQRNVGLAQIPFHEEPIRPAKTSPVTDPLNFVFNERTNRFLQYERDTLTLSTRLAQRDCIPDERLFGRLNARSLGIQNPQGMTSDPKSGQLFVLDAAGRRIVRIAPDAQGNLNPAAANSVARLELTALGSAQLRGIAFNPNNEHLYLMDSNGPKLYEVNGTGALISTRDLAELRIASPQSMVFAPSVDNTDNPATMNLYVTDAGRGNVGGRIVEISLIQPQVIAPLAASAAPTLVQTINTWQWSPPSPDPAGIVYWQATGHLLMTDSEVDEIPGLFVGKNVFEFDLNGSLVNTYSTMSFSKEPTGIAINTDNGHWFFSKDGNNRLTKVILGSDGIYGTADDVLTSWTISGFGVQDLEDVAYGQGKLFIADGSNAEIWIILPGPNGQFDGPPPNGDDTATHFDTSALGVRDPEGIAYHPDTGNLWLVSRRSPLIEVTTTGVLVRSFDIVFLNAIEPDGVTIAPGSNNPFEKHVWIVDRMVDNNQDPNENDGRIYELAIDGALPTPTSTPTSTPMPTSTPTSTPLPTNTQLPTSTPTPTSTPLPTNTLTPTSTPANNTPLPTDTPTPTGTPTNTPLPTNTPTLTGTPTSTPLPTNTPTPTGTPLPPTPTPTNTSLPPTSTPTPTNTSLPPTSTPTRTNTPLPPTSTPTVAPPNLLANPGFELDADNNGKPDNWTNTAYFTRSNDIARSGSFAGKNFATADPTYTANQTIGGLTAGTTYNFAGWVNIPPTGDTFSFTLDVRWRDAAGANIRTDVIKTYTTATNGWALATSSLVAPANTASALVRMGVTSLNATIYVDDFRFGQ